MSSEFNHPIFATVKGVTVYNNGQVRLTFKRKGVNAGSFTLMPGAPAHNLDQSPEIWEVHVTEDQSKVIGEITYDSPNKVIVTADIMYSGASFVCQTNMQP